MRIGINASAQILFGTPLEAVAEQAAEAEQQGFGSFWLNQLSGTDAITALSVIGRDTSSIELGTAVVPTWGRHPEVLAGQALTAQAATGNRLVLGIGLAHQSSVEGRYKLAFERPVRHLREYLDVLVPLLVDRAVDVEGEIWSCTTEMTAPPADPPQVIVAALGPQMLRLTGARADGTILWLVGPKTVGDHIAPTIGGAAEAAGRAAPRVVASVPVAVTDDPDGVRQAIGGILAGYNELPSYRAMLDREGADGPADVAIVGTEDEVHAHLDRFADAGATDFGAVEFGLSDDDLARTREALRAYDGRA